MITRGYFIGEIVDELSAISHQVESRCLLGLTDLNVYLENFFKEILNRVMNLNLQNLNEERSNEPGLDLGDSVAKKAFQITSQNSSAKVNKTLEKYASFADKPYDKIYILIIGKKQGSYTIDTYPGINFEKKNIWDNNTLSKKVIDLPLDRLQDIYDYIKHEVARVKIELEIPTAEGVFATNLNSYIEALPKPRLGDLKRFYASNKKNYDDVGYSPDDLQKDLRAFCNELSKLPRITREFLSFLIERRDSDTRRHSIGSDNSVRFNHDRLKRICRYPDTDGELRLLTDHHLVSFNEPDEFDESPYIRVYFKKTNEGFLYELIQFIETNKIGYQKPIVNLDFSMF